LIHESSIVFDAHCDTLLDVVSGARRLTDRATKGEVDLPRLKEGGVTAQVFAVFVEPELRGRATGQALRTIDAFYQAVAEARGGLLPTTCAADIERAKAAGAVAGILSLEGAEPLDGDLAVLRLFYRLGVRAVGLTWNHRNQAADGVGESRTGGGLTEFGVELVKEMNRLRMMVDVAHLSPRGVQDVLEISQSPVIASHANAWALCPHRRNLTDEQLGGIAASGGVVGVTFYRGFVAEEASQATLDRVVDHIDHLVSVMGVEHVGLGSDFDGFMGEPAPTGLEDVTCLPNLTRKLVERGHAPAAISKILGSNFLRVFQQTVG
jgi:membrane dipeptidase